MFPHEIREDEMHTIVELGFNMKQTKECTYPIHSAFRNVQSTLKKKKKDTNTQNTKQDATTSNTAEIRPKDIVSTYFKHCLFGFYLI